MLLSLCTFSSYSSHTVDPFFRSPCTRNLADNYTCSQSLLYRKCMCTCPVPTTPVLQMPNGDQNIEDWRPISQEYRFCSHLFIDYNYSFDIIIHCCYSCRLINHKYIAFYLIQIYASSTMAPCSIFMSILLYGIKWTSSLLLCDELPRPHFALSLGVSLWTVFWSFCMFLCLFFCPGA